MKDAYTIDLEKYSLQKFKLNLETREMIPSRMILKDALDDRFGTLEKKGIKNLKELTDALSTKDKIAQFSQETGLANEYLKLLNREARSYLSNPVRLDAFPGISPDHLKKLDALCISNTCQLFNVARERSEREKLSQKSGIPMEGLDELVGLADLSRTYGVGPVFARMLYDLGISSIRLLLEHSADDIVRIYEEQTLKKADFGVNEMGFSLMLAKELEIALEL